MPAAFDRRRTIGSTTIPRPLPRSCGAARSARCRHRVRFRQASSGLRHRRRAAPASIGSIATARVTVGIATRLRAPATWPSGQTRAASRPGVARVAHRVRERRTSSVASFSAGACHSEAYRKPGSRCPARGIAGARGAGPLTRSGPARLQLICAARRPSPARTGWGRQNRRPRRSVTSTRLSTDRHVSAGNLSSARPPLVHKRWA